MKLYKPKQSPKYTDITLDDWEYTLRVVFVKELEDSIENHITLLSKISGIKKFKTHPQSNYSNSSDAHSNGSEFERKGQNNDDDDDGGVVKDTEGYEDLGSNVQKRKQEDSPEGETHYGEQSEEIVAKRMAVILMSMRMIIMWHLMLIILMDFKKTPS
ncbi:hypothetical protein Fmac_020415 [Flemingia macrophylla]|uniref:Uncharacterized protein n=1 Tax=Flemingia macrophylla TaxID=520843 RepID=A0ABD1LUK9_9FABA